MKTLKVYPKITIITVVYNSVKTLEQTILSVINQTYENIEYIIIDGGSTDGTIDIIKKYEEQIFYWVSEPDNGIYDAMNKGINIASGEIIGIINADDWYEQTAIELSIVQFEKDEKLEALCGDILAHMECNEDILIKRFVSSSDLRLLKAGMTIMHPSVFVKKSFYNRYGVFDDTIKITADYDLVLRATLKGVKIKYISNLIANFRIGGISGNIWKTNLDLIKVRKKNQIAVRIQIKAILRDFIRGVYTFGCSLLPKQVMLFIKYHRGWQSYKNDY